MHWQGIFKRVKANFIWLVAGQFIYKVIALVSLILIARYLSLKEFGIFSYSLAYVGLFYVLPDLGLSDLLVRESSGNRDLLLKDINIFFTLKIILSLITFATIYISYILHLYNPTISRLVLILGMGIILESLNFLMKAIFQAFEQMKYEAYSLFLEAIIRLALVILAIHRGMGITYIAIALFLSTALGLIISIIFINHKFIKLSFRLEYNNILRYLTISLPFAGLYLLGYVNLKVDIIMLMHMSGEAATGLFGATNRMIEPLLILPIIFGISLAPVISSAIKWERKDALNFLKKSLTLLLPIYISISLIMVLAAPVIFNMVFGSTYAEAAGIFRFLVWFFPLFAIQIVWEKFMNGLRLEWFTVGIYLTGTVLNILFNLFFIPKYGLIGATFSTLLAQVFILAGLFSFLYFIFLHKSGSKKYFFKNDVALDNLNGYDA